jgi:hypothetical protein
MGSLLNALFASKGGTFLPTGSLLGDHFPADPGGKGKALTVLAHKLARAVYYLLTREQPFDLHRFVAA